MELERPSNSALVRRLREAARGKPRSLGFGRDRDDKPTPAVVVVAEVRGLDASAARDAVADGAAAVVFVVDGPSREQVSRDGQAAVQACGGAVAGIALGGEIDAVALAEAGFDFVLAGVDEAPIGFVAVEGVAKVARVDASSQTGLLRALGELPIDAVIAGRVGGAAGLTVLDLMTYRHVVDSMRQAVLVVVDDSIQAEHLQVLRDSGIVGVVLPGRGRVAAFAAAAAKVKATRAAGASSAMAVLPRLGPAAGGDVEHEDDDDDDE
jgi:hypothetical protein